MGLAGKCERPIFSRLTETILDQDLAAVARGESAAALIDRIRLQFGRLEITPDDLEGKDQRSSLFKTMFLTFRARGAKDWHSDLQISLGHSGSQHKLEFHHFFPKVLLSKSGYSSREADDVANLTFMGGRTNRKFSDEAPNVYAQAIREAAGDLPFQQQCVPLDPMLWEVERYRDFLNERRLLIAEALNMFLTGEEVCTHRGLTTEELISKGEGADLEFKSSLRWDTTTKTVNRTLEQVALKSIAAFNNGSGGQLLIGVRDDHSIHGLQADYDCLDGTRDEFERHLRISSTIVGDRPMQSTPSMSVSRSSTARKFALSASGRGPLHSSSWFRRRGGTRLRSYS